LNIAERTDDWHLIGPISLDAAVLSLHTSFG
jgi:hypothetical protein